MTSPMKVFYRPEQCAQTDSYSPSAHKPALVVQDWLKQSDLPIEIHGFEPAKRGVLTLAHDPEYVLGVLAGRIRNGFGNHSKEVARSLPYTTGSMLAAAEHAVLRGEAVCSPTSGFHHAGYRAAEGYCTFNGLMVAALLLKEAGLVNTVGILDCDMHFGNGTQEIMQYLGIRWIRHHTQGSRFYCRRDAQESKDGQSAYFHWLDRALEDVSRCDLVLYQAGADPHEDDPLGGLLSTQEMYERDCRVFQRLAGKPLVWNLAGGYQTTEGGSPSELLEPVLALHRNSLRAWHLAHGQIRKEVR